MEETPEQHLCVRKGRLCRNHVRHFRSAAGGGEGIPVRLPGRRGVPVPRGDAGGRRRHCERGDLRVSLRGWHGGGLREEDPVPHDTVAEVYK